jgi:signal-transduction protein with cAMP-binding, CBS, and nucleotidyltransferase domain
MDSPQQSPDREQVEQLVDIQEFFNRSYIFSGAPGGVTKLFAYLAKRENYTKGQIIMEEGNPCDRCFIIASGEVDIHRHYNDRRFHLQLLKADSLNYFSELALLSEFKWFFSARAWTDATLLSISREAFIKVMERHPESYQNMVKKIVDLHIHRFVNQSEYLMANIAPDAWREDPPEQ